MPVPPDLRALLDAFFRPDPSKSPLALLRAAAELRATAAAAQRSFEALLAVLATPVGDEARAPGPLDGWRSESEGGLGPFRLAGAPEVGDPEDRRIHHGAPQDPAIQRACALLADDRALIQLGYALLLVFWPSGHVLWVLPATEATLLGVAGRWALFGARYGRQYGYGDGLLVSGLYALDLDSRTWLDGPYPDDLPAVFVEKDQPEDAWLFDWRRGRIADVAEDRSGDRAAELTRSPDHRYIWVSSALSDGGIMEAELGLPVTVGDSSEPSLRL